MGGGDLNLKKSWHPSTMKNMEKVWKAEQQENQEKRRIAELKREIEMEKNREDMTKYAMEQGVIEKKDEKKLDWMYKGPNEMVNREEYLLGRPIDKSFEQMAQTQKDTEMNRVQKNHVEYECIPPSLRFFSGNEQVDLARKMQEDPLYAIKKKEMETRSQLLKNPVKLKKLKALLEQQTKEKKSKKKKKKKISKSKKDDSDDETKLDLLLAEKYKQLKDKISEQDIIKSMKKIKLKKKKHSKKHRDSSGCNSDSNVDESVRGKSNCKKRKRSRSTESAETGKEESKKTYNEKRDKTYDTKISQYKGENYESRSTMKDQKNWFNYRDSRRIEDKNEDYVSSKRPRYTDDNYRSYNNYKSNYRERDSTDKCNSSMAQRNYDGSMKHNNYEFVQRKTNDTKNDKSNQKWISKKRHHLSEEEKERKRQEMIANASWRDKEREQKVKQYREEEKKELASNKMNNKDFIRKHLVVAAEASTVASRIKSNINNIQRCGRAMDTNFAKR